MTNISTKISELGKNFLIAVGKNNKPTYPVIAVATANGIFKPISSLTDKKEKPEARKYAALREFCTEVVAVPTYWFCGVGAAKLGGKLFNNNPEQKAIARANMMFLGVCTAAVFVIPAVCSLGLKLLDNFTKKNNSSGKINKLDVTSASPNMELHDTTDINTNFGSVLRPKMQTFANRGGLKI